jgi:hypothetical protein
VLAARKKRRLSPEGRARIIAATKRRWAAVRAAKQAENAAAKNTATKKTAKRTAAKRPRKVAAATAPAAG